VKTVGERVWDRLHAEGGFVWTTADGRKIVSFNKGRHPSAELVAMLKRHREELKYYVDAMHAARDRAWGRPPAIGSSGAIDRNAPNGRGGDVRECNGAARSSISAETPGKWDFSHRRGLCQVAPAVAAVLVAILAVCGEICPAVFAGAGGSVGLVIVLSTDSSSGSGEVSTQQTNGGMAWRRN
jgi:hypothetical protein